MQPDRSGNYWDPNAGQDGLPPAGPPVPVQQPEQPEPPMQPVQPPAPSPYGPPVPADDPDVVAWEASEYLQHANGFGWYAAFAAVVLVLIGISVWRQFWTFTAVIVVMAVAAVIHVRRPPRVMRYVLDDEGLSIGERLHPYEEFKSFALVRDGAFFGIMLIPVRRFMPATLVYFAEDDGERIVDAFGTHLPMEDRDLDLVDRFLRKIRF